MRIIIPTIGSRGDIQPFIALAQGLVHAGHTVTLASHPIMKGLVESYKVIFAPIGPDLDLAREVAAIRKRARNPAIGLMRAMRFGFDLLERSHTDILALCRQADLVVVPSAVASGKNEAELLNLPYLSVTLMPWAIPWDDPQRPWYKRLLYAGMDGLVHQITTQPLNRIRKRQGLAPVGKEGLTAPLLNLVPVSPAVYPPNPLWEPRHRQVGFWFTEVTGWQPPGDLLDFLESGAPPLLVSLGAMSLGDDDAFETASLFVEAIQQAEVRAIIQGWQAGMKQMTLPASIYPAGDLPHGWLLPRCAGVVHHGGYGTTAAGLRAGIPALLIPHIADQFYWGRQVEQLGVGPASIPRSRLERDRLISALHELTNNKGLQEAAARLGGLVRAEQGVADAVNLIEEVFC